MPHTQIQEKTSPDNLAKRPDEQPAAEPKPFTQLRVEEEHPELYDQQRNHKGEAVDSGEGEENKSPLEPIDKNKSPEDWQQNQYSAVANEGDSDEDASA